ncbi:MULTISPECIES: hypothetical protein [unclassified Mycobacterium]|uniref:hypothetical protein n=1 Tax=unclassified Mycobacterium TaxID=2642494 RepID=UPI0029C77D22|nr:MULTISPECIES: hypothetical protein [unclassified Mycobacterium]
MSLDIDQVADDSPSDATTEDGGSAVAAEAIDDTPRRGDTTGDTADAGATTSTRSRFGRISWTRAIAFALLPGLALVLAVGAGYLKWKAGSAQLSRQAAAQSVQVATESTIAMLAYQPDTVDKDLTAAADRLTGSFRGDYTTLINDVVIPGSKAKQISAVATVPAAASISATAQHAVVLVFVDQTTTIGAGAPTASLSSVRVTLDKVGDRWLVSQFEPV